MNTTSVLTTSQTFLKAFKSANATVSPQRSTNTRDLRRWQKYWRRYLLLGYAAVPTGTQVSQQLGFLDLKALEFANLTHSRHPTEVLCTMTFSQQYWWRFPVFWDTMSYRLVCMYVFSVYSISADTEVFIHSKIRNF